MGFAAGDSLGGGSGNRGGEGGRFHAYKSAIEDQTKAHLKTSSKKL